MGESQLNATNFQNCKNFLHFLKFVGWGEDLIEYKNDINSKAYNSWLNYSEQAQGTTEAVLRLNAPRVAPPSTNDLET